MSALVRPVCGRASTMLSIFTASTGPSVLTGSPVKGDTSGTAAWAACGTWPRLAGDELPLSRTAVTATPAAAAAEQEPIAIVRRLNLIRHAPPHRQFTAPHSG